MTELQGAVALAQTRKVRDIVRRRREWCTQLTARLSDCRGIMLPIPTPDGEHSYWFYMMRVMPEQLGGDADEFAADALAKAEGFARISPLSRADDLPLSPLHQSFRFRAGLTSIRRSILSSRPVSKCRGDSANVRQFADQRIVRCSGFGGDRTGNSTRREMV